MTKKKALPHHADDWQGYTIDEIRYQRAYLMARMEISRDRLMSNSRKVADGGISSFGASGMAGRLLGALNYLDIIMITSKVGFSVYKIFRTLRRR